MVWSSSCAVGCAIMHCSKLKLPEGRLWTDAFYVVCNYGPAGNLVGQTPFRPGKPCSACPDRCHNGLCRESPVFQPNILIQPSSCVLSASQCSPGSVTSKARLRVKFQPTPPQKADG